MERITNKQVKQFLNHYQETTEIEILEVGGKEKSDLLKIAKARGYNLDKNTDLAGVKCIYAWTDRANKNGAILPEKAFLKAMPSMIGKPINIGHKRKMVIGHIIDYSYQQKTKKSIMYGVIYKSAFEEEWSQAQKDFKAKKLNVSFEIWSPEKSRNYLADGTYELHNQEIAGCALLFRDDEPAFDGAKVLALAKEMKEAKSELIFASVYKDDELIIADDNIVKQTIAPISQNIRIKCSNCNSDFEAFEASEIKCPSCTAIVNKEGNMIYPPQKKDFQLMCPACKSSHWKILSRDKEGAILKCLNEEMCGKTYKVTWAKEKTKDENIGLSYLYMGRVSCVQCGKVNEVLGTSRQLTKEVKCIRCGLTFFYDIKSEKTYMKISKIVGIDISKNSEKGGNKMKDELKEVKASEEKIETNVEAKDAPKKKVVIEKSEAKPEEQAEVIAKEEIVEATVEPVVEAPKAEEKVEISAVDNYPKTKTLRKAIKKIKDLENTLTTAKLETEEKLKNGIKKVAKQLIEAKKQVELYKVNAKEILTRRVEVGSYEISDEDILNDDKFDKAKLVLENAKLIADREDSNDIVGIKPEQGEDYYAKKQKEINKLAFGHKD